MLSHHAANRSATGKPCVVNSVIGMRDWSGACWRVSFGMSGGEEFRRMDQSRSASCIDRNEHSPNAGINST